MRVLVVSPVLPLPLDSGVRVRIFNTLKELSSRHAVDLVCTVERTRVQSEVSEAQLELARVCRSLYIARLPNRNPLCRLALKSTHKFLYWTTGTAGFEFYYNLPPLTSMVRRLVAAGGYDVLLTYYWWTAVGPIAEAPLPTICDTIDIVWKGVQRRLAKSEASWVGRWMNRRHLARVRRREAEVLNSHDLLICVHEKDVLTLREETSVTTPAVSFGHVRDANRLPYACEPMDENVVLFFGALHSPMNADGARRAATELLPLIRRRCPDARLVIAGSGVGSEIQALGSLPGVSVTGHVPELAELYHRAKVLLMPLSMGAGIKGRVLEAMEAGTLVVGTSIAAEGIPVTPGENMIVADDAEEMADHTVSLLSDYALRRRISMSARSFVEQTYTWDNTYGRIHRCLELARTNYYKREQ